MKDHLVKAVADGVRVYAAVTTDLVNEAIRRHDCYPVAAAALGRTMTGALLFAANLKNKEAVTITFDGHGPLGKVTADAVPEGFVRGAVGNPHVNLPLNAKGKIDVGGGVGADGMVTVTRFTGLRNPVTGSTALTDGEIADDLTKYLYDSEQTPSSVGLGVLVDPDFHCIGACRRFPAPAAAGRDGGDDRATRGEPQPCAVRLPPRRAGTRCEGHHRGAPPRLRGRLSHDNGPCLSLHLLQAAHQRGAAESRP